MATEDAIRNSELKRIADNLDRIVTAVERLTYIMDRKWHGHTGWELEPEEETVQR